MRRIIVGAQGRVMPYFDEVFGEEIDRVFEEKCDLLLGRKTYEIFAAYWPYYDETAPHGGIATLQCRSCSAAAKSCSRTAQRPTATS